MSSNNDELDGQGTATIQLISTWQAAYYADDTLVRPCCWVNVYGPPGDKVSCTLTSGPGQLVVPSESDPYDGDGTVQDTYSPLLNENGVARFLVRAGRPPSSDETLQLASVVVTAIDVTGGGSGTATPTFQAYFDANENNHITEHFVGYNYTTNAPADNYTPCSVYVKVDATKYGGVLVVVDGSATIAGTDNLQSTTVDLQEDGTAAIMIIDDTAETVNVRLSLPHAPSTDALGAFQVTFCEVPAINAAAGQA
jgi:hypothetical protein